MTWLLYPWARDLVPTAQETGWAQSQTGWVQKTWPARGFNPWIVQPVTSHNANYDISAQKQDSETTIISYYIKIFLICQDKHRKPTQN